jgi:hypothetical protein
MLFLWARVWQRLCSDSESEERAFNSANPSEKIESKLAEASGVQLAK